VPTTPQSAVALSLAPLGTTPVAVFPPYVVPRTVPSSTVIFAENPTALIQALRRSLTLSVAKYVKKTPSKLQDSFTYSKLLINIYKSLNVMQKT